MKAQQTKQVEQRFVGGLRPVKMEEENHSFIGQ
jgi:hypothetical protein